MYNLHFFQPIFSFGLDKCPPSHNRAIESSDKTLKEAKDNLDKTG